MTTPGLPTPGAVYVMCLCSRWQSSRCLGGQGRLCGGAPGWVGVCSELGIVSPSLPSSCSCATPPTAGFGLAELTLAAPARPCPPPLRSRHLLMAPWPLLVSPAPW